MKKVVKFFLIGLGLVALPGIAGFIYIESKGIPKYDVAAPDIKIDVTPEKLQRGEKLASMLCASCHMNRETRSLSGRWMTDAPKEFGKIYVPNITQDKTYGIGNWTDGEILYLLRTGIKKDGSYAPPYMAKLPHMADEDIESIIAFLRSDHPMVKPVAVEDHPTEPSFLTKFLCNVEFKPFDMPKEKIPMPDTTNQVELGRYLVYNLECYTCHSADFTKLDMMTPENSKGFMGGGNEPLDNEGNPMVTSNITPDRETGIGDWTKEQFVKAVRFGLMESEPALRVPMIPYTQLTDYEAEAIFAYIQTIDPIKNDLKRSMIED